MGYDSYGMVVDLACLCPEKERGSYAVRVRGGKLRSVTPLDGDRRLPESLDRRTLTVSGLHELIAELLKNANHVEATFDDAGVPIAVAVDFSERDDNYLKLEVRDFLPHRSDR